MLTTNELPPELVVIDSHTEGEPTRVILSGWPELVGNTMAQRRDYLAANHVELCRAVILEPRGYDAIVGSIITPPECEDSACGVVFFNNLGPLLMCGHGLMGVIATLHRLGKVGAGRTKIDTPVGQVSAELDEDGLITIRNVASYVQRKHVRIDIAGHAPIVGDICFGGNWFFLSHQHEEVLELHNRQRLTELCEKIMEHLDRQGFRGADGERVDHVELVGAPSRKDADAKNWVLCPGGAYDRSPCGTGTSAHMVCLHAHGDLEIGQRWRQESITGSRFVGWLERHDDKLIPHIQGRAFITGHSTLYFDVKDPFRFGLPPAIAPTKVGESATLLGLDSTSGARV